MAWRLIDSDLSDPYWSACADDCLLEGLAQNIAPNTLHLYRRRPAAVSLGRFQSLEGSVDVDRASSEGIAIVRRISGGGTIYTDDKQLIIALVTRDILPSAVDVSLQTFCETIRTGLRRLGIEATFKPDNDILVAEGKVSGAAQARRRSATVQHATILVDFPLPFPTVLRRQKNKHRLPLTSLIAEGFSPTMAALKDAIIGAISDVFGTSFETGSFTSAENVWIEKHLPRFRSDGWREKVP